MYPGAPALMVTPGQAYPNDPCLPALEDQGFVTPWPYYSRCKFVFARTTAAPGPFQYDVATGVEARAFSYAVGEGMGAAGFTAGDGNATFAETNLTIRNQTTSAEDVYIHGVAIQILPAISHLNAAEIGVIPRMRPVDHTALAALNEAVAVSLSLNGGQQSYPLGIISMLPGAGGITGGAGDITGRGEATLGVRTRDLGYATNGWATRANFYPVPEGLIWRHQGNRDSQLNVIFRTVRQVRVFSGGSPENNIAVVGVDVATTGLYPTELAVGLHVHLIGSVYGPRSKHQ